MLGNGVQVPADEDALGPPERRAGDQGVRVTGHREVLAAHQRRLDGIGQGLLMMGLAGNVDQRGGELGNPRRQVHRWGISHVATVAV